MKIDNLRSDLPRDEDEFDQFLNRRGSEQIWEQSALPPALIETAFRLTELSNAYVAANANSPDATNTWETIMNSYSIPGAAANSPEFSVNPSSAIPAPATRIPKSSRSRYFGYASAVAILLTVGALATYLFLVMPNFRTEPSTTIPAAASGPTPTAPSLKVSQIDHESGTSADGTFYIRPAYADCTATPASFESVMEIVLGEKYPFDSGPPSAEFATLDTTVQSGWLYWFDSLPEGTTVNGDDIEAVTTAYGLYLGCEDVPLRQATVLTAEGLALQYHEVPSVYVQDGDGPSGHAIAMLWADNMGRQSPDPDHIGKLSWAYLYGFRHLPDGRIAAYLTGPKGPDTGEVPAFYDSAGYVIFEKVGDAWLIDEQFRR